MCRRASATRYMDTLDDVDMFQLRMGSGDFQVAVTPDADDDVRLDLHDSIGRRIATSNNNGAGGIEGNIIQDGIPGTTLFAVIYNEGNSAGTYTISFGPAPEE